MAVWTAQSTAVVAKQVARIWTGSQRTVAHWRNDQTSDQRIDRRNCLRDTASVRAVGDIEFCSDFLTRQFNQSIALW